MFQLTTSGEITLFLNLLKIYDKVRKFKTTECSVCPKFPNLGHHFMLKIFF